MWFDAEKLAKILRHSGVSKAELTRLLDCPESDVEAILNGEDAADIELAEQLLQMFGARFIAYAIDWRRTSYAG
jgi:plasmid maintenance system antidote protein VapI